MKALGIFGGILTAATILWVTFLAKKRHNYGNKVLPFPPNPSDTSLDSQKNDLRFYVDPIHGNDRWSGRLLKPNGHGDGPFRTLQKAITGVRIQRHFLTQKATIYLRGGTHFVRKTIVLDKRDSYLAIIAYPKDPPPIVSGAVKISGRDFKQQNHMWVAPFKGECSKHVFLGTKRLIRARKPNLKVWNGENLTGEGPYLIIKDLLLSTPTCNRNGTGGFTQRNCPAINKLGFIFQPGDIDPNWLKSQSKTPAEILVFQAWTAERNDIKSIKSDIGKVFFTKPLRFPVGMHPRPSGWRYIVENVKAELDAVGEFFCDPDKKLLYIIPPKDALDTQDVYISQTTRLFSITEIKQVSFINMEFRHSDDDDNVVGSVDPEFSFSKNENLMGYKIGPGLLEIKKSSFVQFRGCTFSNVGYTGLYIEDCVNVQVRKNKFQDIGYIGITTIYSNGNPYYEFSNRNILIDHNQFKGCGVINMFQPTCMLIQGVKNITISRNDVALTPYAPIRVGWQPTFNVSYVSKGDYVFRIRRNHVHDFGSGILNDFAGIYLSSNGMCESAARDIKQCYLHAMISENKVHHSHAFNYGGLGVYGDTAVSALTVENNWLYKLSDCAINFHCGQHNKAVNNMIYHINKQRVFGTCKSVGPGSIPKQILTIERNVIFVANTSAAMYGKSDQWTNDVPSVNYNDYYFHPFLKKTFETFFPKHRSWETWRNETGNDRKSIIKNPHFWNIKRNDYRLQKHSPALKLGIHSVDLRKLFGVF